MIFNADGPLVDPGDPKGEYFDRYEYYKVAERLVKNIKGSPNKFVFGIYGPWGSGKSTMLNFIENAIEKDVELPRKYKVITFDTWPYANSGSLVEPLIAKIATEYENLSGNRKKAAILKSIKGFFQGVRTISYAGFSGVLRVTRGVGFKDFKEDAEAIEAMVYGEDSWEDPIAKVQNQFKEIVDSVLGTGEEKRLIFLIDNLDRCLPEQVISLLESFSNFLDANRCIFYIAVDHRVLVSYIKSKYGESGLSGYEYLEKIVLFNVHLPVTEEIAREGLWRYIYHLGNVYLSEDVCHGLADFFSTFPRLTNPRRILRIVNRFLWLITPLEQSKYREPLSGLSDLHKSVIAAISLYHGWPEFYINLFSIPYKDLRRLEQNPQGIKYDSRRSTIGQALGVIFPSGALSSDNELTAFLAESWTCQMIISVKKPEFERSLEICGIKLEQVWRERA